MRVYIWCDGAAMPNGPAVAGYVVVGDVRMDSPVVYGHLSGADQLAKDGARASKARSADRPRYASRHVHERRTAWRTRVTGDLAGTAAAHHRKTG